MSRQYSAKAKHICSVEVIHSGWHHGRTSCVCSARQGIKCSEWRAQCDFLQRTCILENSRELGHDQEPEIWFATRVAPHLELANSCLLFFSFGFGWGRRVGARELVVSLWNPLCDCAKLLYGMSLSYFSRTSGPLPLFIHVCCERVLLHAWKPLFV